MDNQRIPTFGIILIISALLISACQTPEDPADEEFYFAEARGEQNLALSYLKRAQFARKKQVEYLELAEEQETKLRELRSEIAQRRMDNNKRAQQVQGLKKELAALDQALKDTGASKTGQSGKLQTLKGEKSKELAAISALEQEINALKKKRATLEQEAKELREAFGSEK